MKIKIINKGNIFFREGDLEENYRDIGATETKPVIIYPLIKDVVKKEREGKKVKMPDFEEELYE